jgi:hypothetical protein
MKFSATYPVPASMPRETVARVLRSMHAAEDVCLGGAVKFDGEHLRLFAPTEMRLVAMDEFLRDVFRSVGSFHTANQYS